MDRRGYPAESGHGLDIVAIVVIVILVIIMLWYVQEAPLPVGGFR